jgi:hypothetical protein
MPAGRLEGSETQNVADYTETIRDIKSRYVVVFDPSHTFTPWRAKLYVDEIKCMLQMGVFDDETILLDNDQNCFYTVRKTGAKGRKYTPQGMYQSTKQELVEAGIDG